MQLKYIYEVIHTLPKTTALSFHYKLGKSAVFRRPSQFNYGYLKDCDQHQSTWAGAPRTP